MEHGEERGAVPVRCLSGQGPQGCQSGQYPCLKCPLCGFSVPRYSLLYLSLCISKNMIINQLKMGFIFTFETLGNLKENQTTDGSE